MTIFNSLSSNSYQSTLAKPHLPPPRLLQTTRTKGVPPKEVKNAEKLQIRQFTTKLIISKTKTMQNDTLLVNIHFRSMILIPPLTVFFSHILSTQNNHYFFDLELPDQDQMAWCLI